MTKIVQPNAAQGYITAEEAASILGVARATLYVYVSRHGLRSVPVAGSKQRLYWKDDILQVRRPRGRPRTASAEPVPESAISLISGSRLYYRGHDVVELSESATFEEVAALLWNGDAAQLFTDRLPEVPEVAVRIGELMAQATGTERAMAMLPLIEAANPRAFDLSSLGMMQSGVDVLRSVTAILLGTSRPAAAPLHDQIGERYSLNAEWRDLLRRLLVLSADLGFEPTAVAVRGVASVGISPYRSVLAGLMLLGARQTRLGRIEGMAGLIDEILEGDPEQAVVRRLREGNKVPGFGGGVFPAGDPRALALMEALARITDLGSNMAKLQRATDVVRDALGVHPSFTMVTHYIGRCIGHDSRESLIGLGRCAGWIAHAREQYQAKESQRPSSIYVGELPTR